MKFVFLVGGLVGFTTATVAGWAADRAPDLILLDSMMGALVGAVLFRWLWNILLRGMRETLIARRTAAAAAVLAAQATDPKKKK